MVLVPQLLLYLFYIPALISNIFIAFILRKYLKFGAFHQIFLASGILDILHCVIYLWLHWVQNCYPGELYENTKYFSTFFDLLFSFTHFLCNLSMAFNRFSATFISSSKFWSAELVRIYIASILVISTISCLPVLVDHSDIIISEKIVLSAEATQRLILSGVILISDSLSIILTIVTIYRIRHFQTSHEKKLIIVTASHTVIATVVLIYEITKALKFTDPISVFLANYRQVIAYFFISFNFGTILIADSRVRQDFKAFFKMSNENAVVSVWSSDTS